jgi:hypothetical protein
VVAGIVSRFFRPKRSIGADVFFILFYLYAVFFSPYISSWLPPLAGFPVGAMVREVAIIAFLVYFIFSCALSSDCRRGVMLYLYALVVVFTFISFLSTDATFSQYIIGVNSFVAFPAVFALIYLRLRSLRPSRRVLLLKKIAAHLSSALVVIALLGIFDVILGGKLIELLGYNPNYGGEDFVLVTRYYDTVRANAGIGDALAYGYLMSAAVIYFLNEMRCGVRSPKNIIGLAACTIACFLSLTRGAILATVFAYILFFISKRGVVFLSVLVVAGYLVVANSSYGELYLGRFTDSDDGSAHSSELRLVMAEASIDFLTNNPLGIGIGTQGSGNLLSDTDLRLNTDNYFFHIFLELGLLGGLLFLVYILSQMYFFARVRSEMALKASVIVLFLLSSALSSSIAFATLCVPFWLLNIVSIRRSLVD